MLQRGKTLILGLEAMVCFGLKLDFNIIKTKYRGESLEKELTIKQLIKEENSLKPLFVKFKVSRKVELLNMKPILLTLKIMKFEKSLICGL